MKLGRWGNENEVCMVDVGRRRDDGGCCDGDFSDGDTATATFDKVNKDNTENNFFKANIE